MTFSRSTEYAIQALLYLTVNGDGKTPVHLRAITGSLKIPHHFLSKVLQTLSKNEIIVSFRGSNGGFTLGKRPSEISLMDVAVAIDGKAFLDRCILGYSKCGSHEPCPAHDDWVPVRERFLAMLEKTTFKKLSDEWDGDFEKLGLSMPRSARVKR
jgi:Rrf2 family iron-sulfur cluster assembly transcriptional regulator